MKIIVSLTFLSLLAWALGCQKGATSGEKPSLPWAGPAPVRADPERSGPRGRLEEAKNADTFPLSEAERRLLAQYGFAVSPTPFDEMYELYEAAREGNRPQFVTSDAVLHTGHLMFDYLLRLAEIDHLIRELDTLTADLLTYCRKWYEEQGVMPLKIPAGAFDAAAALRRNVGFLALAARLLGLEVEVPPYVRKEVEAELKLIDAHGGFAASPLFGYREDYSQYVPRGHYTRNRDFRRYFRAMMWYGRMSFPLSGHRFTPDQIRQFTAQALFLMKALQEVEGAWERWERIYEPTVFFVGKTDDLDIHDYAPLAKRIFGSVPPRVFPRSQLDEFIAAARKLRPPRIVSTEVTDREVEAEGMAAVQGFRFMGQRFVPDSYVFQQLVYSRVGSYQGRGRPFTAVPGPRGLIRGFPRGLDVLAVFGSEAALAILREEGDTDYVGYDQQLTKLRSEFAALTPEEWGQNLYYSTLHTLRALLSEEAASATPFDPGAWLRKQLHTALGAWAELRHDTILYAKQSYTLRATAIPIMPTLTHGYVEPVPEVYARLRELLQQMSTGLERRGLLPKAFARKLEDFTALLRALETIAQWELAGEGLSEEQYRTIWNFGGTLRHLAQLPPDQARKIADPQVDSKMALVADVHTDTNSRQVLEEAVGRPGRLVALVPVGGQWQLCEGAVFSYYEFKQPLGQRLTDEQWQERLERGDVPPRPTWAEFWGEPLG
ncbi:MAG TPA: DUF3160 domain-containing protein [Armatimonadetes bacterium]|nr:DUF3160 domain-containing protein [Armatimonadota bacterium]